jgi:hypothetical protein
MGNYVIAGVGNCLIANPSNLGNFMIADIQRLQALNDASGLGPRCGMAGADTATRGWAEEHLVAAHTRCVVGLGPPPAGHDRAAGRAELFQSGVTP